MSCNAATRQPTNPTLSWGTSSSATSYQYCINTTASCKVPAAWITTGSITHVTLTGLTQGKKYYWQVQATNATGTTYANGSSTAWWSFTIAYASTPTKTSVAPTPTATNTNIPPTPTPTTVTSTPIIISTSDAPSPHTHCYECNPYVHIYDNDRWAKRASYPLLPLLLL